MDARMSVKDQDPAQLARDFCNAAKDGDVERLEQLLSCGADVNGITVDRSGLATPLHLALQHGRFEKTLAWLIDHGADVNIDIEPWSTPLKTVCTSPTRSPKAVAQLLEAGAHINKIYGKGNTVIHEFCRIAGNALFNDLGSPATNVTILRMLIEAGADPRTVNARGMNAFHLLVDFRDSTDARRYHESRSAAELAKILLEYGADPYAKDESGRCAIELAYEPIFSYDGPTVNRGRGCRSALQRVLEESTSNYWMVVSSLEGPEDLT